MFRRGGIIEPNLKKIKRPFKMPINIKDIILETNLGESSYNDVPIVKIIFKFPCEWTVLHAEDLKQILKLWIRGEQTKLNGKYKDALYLQKLILEAFREEKVEFERGGE